MTDEPDGVSYRRFPPPAGAVDLVEHLWVVRGPHPGSPRREVLVPDGRPFVAVPLLEPGLRIRAGGRTEANDGLLHGMVVDPVVLEERGASWYVGARLTLTGATRLAGRALPADATAPLAALLGRPALQAELRHAAAGARHRGGPPPEEDATVARALGEALVARAVVVGGGVVPKDRVRALDRAAGCAEASPATARVTDMARAAGTHPSTLRRWFVEHVGVTPKTFSAVVRFHAFVGELLRGAPAGTSVPAALAGYADASHAAAEVRRFTGLAPRELRRRQNGIAALMHDLGSP